MTENCFQCIDDKNEQESCRHCGSLHFKKSETNAKVILCYHCDAYHKTLEPSLTTASDIMKKMGFANQQKLEKSYE